MLKFGKTKITKEELYGAICCLWCNMYVDVDNIVVSRGGLTQPTVFSGFGAPEILGSAPLFPSYIH